MSHIKLERTNKTLFHSNYLSKDLSPNTVTIWGTDGKISTYEYGVGGGGHNSAHSNDFDISYETGQLFCKNLLNLGLSDITSCL